MYLDDPLMHRGLLLLAVVKTPLRNELVCGVALEEAEEQPQYLLLLFVGVAVVNLDLFSIRDDGDVFVIVNLTWYFHDWLQGI